MSGSPSSIFVSRIKGLPVLDASGDQVGKVRDVVVQNRTNARSPRVKGLVVELLRLRKVFLPMERVHAIDAQQVIIQGVVNTVAFQRREAEALVYEDLFDKKIDRPGERPASIFDLSIVQTRTRAWEVDEVALKEVTSRSVFSRGHVVVVDWDEVPDFFVESGQGTEQVLAQLAEMKPADVARELHEMSPERRAEVVDALEDEALAEALLQRMEPEDAEDVRLLLNYDRATAGGLMTPEPVVLGPDATVADCLALLRNEEVTPALAALAFLCRPPLDTPTGRYLGAVHIQRLLREPPSMLAAGLVDSSITPLAPSADVAHVSRYFATYDLVCAPVVNDKGMLVGAVTVDDVLDHILPADWRRIQLAQGVSDG